VTDADGKSPQYVRRGRLKEAETHNYALLAAAVQQLDRVWKAADEMRDS
jgi:hypothetical protein